VFCQIVEDASTNFAASVDDLSVSCDDLSVSCDDNEQKIMPQHGKKALELPYLV
jgi:hypothetical protein